MEETIPVSDAILHNQFRNAEQSRPWSLGSRIAFRFCLCYLLPFGVACLFLFADFVHLMTGAPAWDVQRFDPWQASLRWICVHLFRTPESIVILPDGDYLSGYLQHLFELILAVAVTVVWSIIDRKRTHYPRLHAWFALFLRFSLAIVLFAYGFDKVFPMQFRTLTPSRLSQRVGDVDIFNMLWIFMASSKPYTIFTGAMEVLAGLLLITPRLETLGALLAVPVLTNVFLLNMCYDVPVKIVSSHLLLLALFLAAPVLPCLIRIMVQRQSVRIIAPPRLTARRNIDRAAHVGLSALGLLMVAICWFAANGAYSRRQADAAAAEGTPLVGLWIVDTFMAQVAGTQSLFTDKLQQEYHLGPGSDSWNSLAIDSAKRMTIELRGGFRDTVDLIFDSQSGCADVTDSDDPAWKARLTFHTIGSDHLRMTGTVNDIPVSSTWHRKILSDFVLARERFKWIQPEEH